MVIRSYSLALLSTFTTFASVVFRQMLYTQCVLDTVWHRQESEVKAKCVGGCFYAQLNEAGTQKLQRSNII